MNNIKPVGKFAKFFIKNYQISLIIIILMVVGGILGVFKLPKEGMPRVDIPYAGINTIYTGATPQDVEEKITNPLEKAASSSENVKTIESSSMEGYSAITITFNADADIDRSVDKLRQNIENAKDLLPDDAENPSVVKFDASSLSILINVVGPYNNKQLTENAKIIKDELNSVGGVKEINILGGAERKINIEIDFNKLSQYQLNYQDITNAIKSNNISLPGGYFQENDKSYPIQVDGRIKDYKEIKEIKVGSNKNQPILLKDVASIKDIYQTDNRMPRTGYLKDGKLISNKSLSISITTIKNSNLIQISDEITEKLSELKKNKLDQDIEAILVYDEADEARQQIGDLIRSAWQGLIIIFIVLFVFISLRSSLVIALSIPLSLLFVFLVFSFTNLTLNTVTLFSLILTLGILVDTTIVIVEGIQHNLQIGLSKKDAAIKSVSDVGGPIITSTLTTILVFIPIAMMGGITGEFIKFIPYTVITVLSGALLISLSIIPFLGKTLLKLSHRQQNKIDQEGNIEWKLVNKYINRLGNILNSRFKKIAIILIVLGLFAASISLPASGRVIVDLWPAEDDMDFFQISAKYPPGTSEETKDKILNQIGAKIEELFIEDVEISKIMVSYAPFSIFGGPFASASSQDSLIVKLIDMRKRELTSTDVIDKIEDKLANIKDVEIQASNFSLGPPKAEFPVEVQIANDDLSIAKNTAIDLANFLRNQDEINKISDGVQNDKSPQINIQIDRNKLNFYGVPSVQVAQIIRNIYQPEKIGEVFDKESNKNVDLYLNTLIDTNKIDQLKNINIFNSPTGPIKLNDVSKVEKVDELKSIKHYDNTRYVEVKASLKDNVDSNEIIKRIKDYYNDNKLNELGINIDAITFRGEFEEEDNAFSDFKQAFIFALILIFMVLVFQFKSFLQPFIIMLVIPLSMIGVFFGLYLTKTPISFLGLLGIIALAGIVVNDSIVLLDRFNKLRDEGKTLKKAVKEGTKLRIRSVLSTSITTIGGIFPLTVTISFWKPLGVAMISGLIISTILTLLITPVIYYSLTSITNKLFKKK